MIEATVANSADNAEVVLEKKHQGEMLRDALTKLSPEHREIIDLVYYHEKSVDEAAEILGIPAATVKTRMFYARKKLAVQDAEPSSPHYKGTYEKLPKEQREYPPIRADSLRPRTTLGVECPRRNEKCAKELSADCALARAEAQNGNTVAAENYYQHAEHYFRSMSSDRAK